MKEQARELALSLISIVKKLINPYRPKGVSCYQLEEAIQLLDELATILIQQPKEGEINA